MLQTPGSHEVFTLNGRPDLLKEAGELAGVQHFGFRLCEEEIEKAGVEPIGHGTRGQDSQEVWAFFNDPDGYNLEIFWAPHA